MHLQPCRRLTSEWRVGERGSTPKKDRAITPRKDRNHTPRKDRRGTPNRSRTVTPSKAHEISNSDALLSTSSHLSLKSDTLWLYNTSEEIRWGLCSFIGILHVGSATDLTLRVPCAVKRFS